VKGSVCLLRSIWKVTGCCMRPFQRVFPRCSGRAMLQSNGSSGRFLKITCVIIAIFLLFNTEFISAMVGVPHRTSISLGGKLPAYPPFSEPEMRGIEWLLKNMNSSLMVYGDSYGYVVFRGYLKRELVETFYRVERGEERRISNKPRDRSYIYLTHLNLEERKFYLRGPMYEYGNVMNLTDVTFLHYTSQICSNGYSMVHILPP